MHGRHAAAAAGYGSGKATRQWHCTARARAGNGEAEGSSAGGSELRSVACPGGSLAAGCPAAASASGNRS